MTTTTDRDGHEWEHDAKTSTWKRSTPKRQVVITNRDFAAMPFELDIQAHGFSIQTDSFQTFDAAAHMAHILVSE